MRGSLLVPSLAILGACSTLGPVPTATAVSPIPRQRFDAELQLAAVPGFYLSGATAEPPKGSPIAQLSALIEPGVIEGLVIGGRVFGPGHDTGVDPMIGYRRTFGDDKRMALSLIGFGAHQEATQKRASYRATRIGGELGGDLRLGAQRPWLEPHLDLALSVTGISASGDYCMNADGHGVDCPDEPAPAILTHASASGAYPAVTAGATLLLGRHHESWIHGGRALLMFGAGLMPRVDGGVQASAQPYASAGLALSISFGAPR
jgi:hypothetical protein